MKVKRKWKKAALLFLAALIATPFICDLTENVSEKVIRGAYETLIGEPGKRFLVDESGIPIVDYKYQGELYIGEQRNPVTISLKALEYYERYEAGDEEGEQLFLNCSDWLIDNAVLYDSYAVLEYEFYWSYGNMTPPWRSGMAQGLALQVLIRAHSITNDEKYLNSAQRLLNCFFVGLENGGVTRKSAASGWWYEEYADEGSEETRVLNGMMFAVIGIHDYYQYTGDADAKYLFDQGIKALEKGLPMYDNNGNSYYDILGNPSGKYHDIHIELLDQLYRITDRDIFKEYHHRWKDYKESFFVLRLIARPTRMGCAIFVGNFFVLLLLVGVIYILSERRKIKN